MHTQNTIKYIAVDDSLLDRLLLEEYADKNPFFKKLGTYDSPEESLVAVTTLQPDLIFLDIEMPGMTGVDVLRTIRQQVPLAVFITSHAEFALDGFELSAFDYILKPLTEERFAATAKRLQEYWEMKQNAAAYEVLFEQESVVIKEGYTQIKLLLHEIIYLEAMQDYTKVITAQKSYLTLTTLTAFLQKVASKKFMRIHRSYAVALSKIESIETGTVNCGGFALPIGKTYKSEIAKINF
ncbi:MAG: LytR/AlgR family response regulator transcription factor [Niabella sp.]